MRLWSLHPKYLDAKGIVALWREALLAKNVLENKTKGYRNHPQLLRFRNSADPLDCINFYLDSVCKEAYERGYRFDRTKIGDYKAGLSIPVTSGQLTYEKEHLKRKLSIRDLNKLALIDEEMLNLHPLFNLIDGDIEHWEIVKV